MNSIDAGELLMFYSSLHLFGSDNAGGFFNGLTLSAVVRDCISRIFQRINLTGLRMLQSEYMYCS